MSDLYENIKSACEKQGISVSAMCLQLGMSKSTMSDLKAGRKKSLSTDTLIKIAEFLNVSADELIGRASWHENGYQNIDVLSEEKEVSGHNGTSLYGNIIALCRERGITVGRMCTDLNISRGNLSDLKMERIKLLGAENTAKIANYFGVSIEYLLSGEKEKPAQEDEPENPDIRMIARAGKKMTPEQAENLRKFAQYMFPEAFDK